MLLDVVVQVEAPDDASHYTGCLLEGPTWYKQKMVAGRSVWFYCRAPGTAWRIHGDHAPPFLRAIEPSMKKSPRSVNPFKRLQERS